MVFRPTMWNNCFYFFFGHRLFKLDFGEETWFNICEFTIILFALPTYLVSAGVNIRIKDPRYFTVSEAYYNHMFEKNVRVPERIFKLTSCSF